AVVGHHHFLDEVGMVDHNDPFGTEPKGHHIAIGLGALRQKSETIPAKSGQISQEPVPFRSGRDLLRLNRCHSHWLIPSKNPKPAGSYPIVPTSGVASTSHDSSISG